MRAAASQGASASSSEAQARLEEAQRLGEPEDRTALALLALARAVIEGQETISLQPDLFGDEAKASLELQWAERLWSRDPRHLST